MPVRFRSDGDNDLWLLSRHQSKKKKEHFPAVKPMGLVTHQQQASVTFNLSSYLKVAGYLNRCQIAQKYIFGRI